MPVPFGFSVGDFVVISKLIYKISIELKKNSESATDYQLLLVELEALDRTLQSLAHIKVTQHGQRRLDGIRALALACKLPLQEFLDRIAKFERSLGSWNTNNRSISSIAKRLHWSAKYKDEARILRERLSPNLATISILLMTQTVDSLSQSEPGNITSIQGMSDDVATHSQILTELKTSANRVKDSQDHLVAGQSHLLATVSKQDEKLDSLKSRADELLESSGAHGVHLQHQSRILEQAGENITTLQKAADENHALLSSINEGMAETKASIPSILTRVLDILGAVLVGISKMQDIMRLMRKMIRLTAKFTVEMRDTLQKLLQAFCILQAQLARMETFMHRRICPPTVVFRDAFNVVRAFPYDLSRDWETFQGLVALAFTGRQGLHRVNLGQYFVTNARAARRLNPTFWSNAIEPGDELSMTMILDDVEAQEGFCPYKSCGASTSGVTAVGGGKICPQCSRYAALSTRTRSFNRTSPESQELDPVIDTDPPRSEEDIDLYCSIQVIQAPVFGGYETKARSEVSYEFFRKGEEAWAQQGLDGQGDVFLGNPPRGMVPGAPGQPQGNHALQDYQLQLMLLEQLNKKRLFEARQEQDNMSAPYAQGG